MDNETALKFIRQEVMFEYQLMSSRISWLITCQSFLIAAYTFSFGNVFIYKAGWFVQYVLPILGLLLCVPAFIGILGASRTISDWRSKQYALLIDAGLSSELAKYLIDRFKTPPPNDYIHKVSERFAISLPIALSVFWVICFLLRFIFPPDYIS